MKHVLRLITAALLVSTLAACAVGPDYHAPDTAPAALLNADSTAAAPLLAQTPDGLWWQQFDDPVLTALVTRALEANLDLRIAIDRVRAARAGFNGAEFDYGPHVPLSAGYTHGKQQQPGFGSQRFDAESYSLGFDAQWEIDLFGHVRRSVEAARGDLGAEQANLRDAQITVAAEVARNYFALRGTQQQIAVAQQNLANQNETLRLTTVRYDAGRGTELDVQRARARLKDTEASLPLLETARAAAAYRLAVLLGQRPGALDAQLLPVTTPAYAKALPIGDPTTLLRNRPDVRAAEQQLAAATARVGVATADLFPRVSISGFIGFLSGDFGHLFSASSGDDARAWSVSPAVSWAALDYGSVQARLRASKAQADGALANYEKTVLTALEDTENAFVNYRERQNRLKSLLEQSAASRRAAELAAVQYREGVADFLTLLDAQRTQLAAEDAVAAGEAEVNAGVVAIYKALGGVGQPAENAVAAR